jgi:hypothetical protein
MAIKPDDAIPSANSERVKILLHEKGLPYERVTRFLRLHQWKLFAAPALPRLGAWLTRCVLPSPTPR